MKVQLRYSPSGSIADTGNHQLNLALIFFRELPDGYFDVDQNDTDDATDDYPSLLSVKVGDFFSHGTSLFIIDSINSNTRKVTALVLQPRANRGLMQMFSLDDRTVVEAVANFAR